MTTLVPLLQLVVAETYEPHQSDDLKLYWSNVYVGKDGMLDWFWLIVPFTVSLLLTAPAA